jgi:hypothetical protein
LHAAKTDGNTCTTNTKTNNTTRLQRAIWLLGPIFGGINAELDIRVFARKKRQPVPTSWQCTKGDATTLEHWGVIGTIDGDDLGLERNIPSAVRASSNTLLPDRSRGTGTVLEATNAV